MSQRGRKPKLPVHILEKHQPGCCYNCDDNFELTLKGMRMLHWTHGKSLLSEPQNKSTIMCLIFGCPNPQCSAEAALPFEYVTAQLKLKHLAECLKTSEE